MPRLILLNGAPAVGKSTLARRYAADRPLALVLDLDQLRRTLGRWRDDPGGAGLRARSIAVAMVREHLAAGYDVVVPQLVGRVEFIERLAAAAAESGAGFDEVYLRDDADRLVRRFAERAQAAVDPVHVEAREILDGGEARLREYHERMEALVRERPQAIGVESVPGDVEATYRRLLAAIG
ncbi:AAA family ATPase [Glycomyces artemisiae]|uniref:AAA domain-containing protein n=1 Tax=Glycomyces artemisiae TaxID=1076443 RepID=A0A2T0UF99_9ACTN|nr:AAA family ATPase [Glycomyces artemisiae]PRY56544.1 AAA domain-containing protein [Glycomyces artemisiae]